MHHSFNSSWQLWQQCCLLSLHKFSVVMMHHCPFSVCLHATPQNCLHSVCICSKQCWNVSVCQLHEWFQPILSHSHQCNFCFCSGNMRGCTLDEGARNPCCQSSDTKARNINLLDKRSTSAMAAPGMLFKKLWLVIIACANSHFNLLLSKAMMRLRWFWHRDWRWSFCAFIGISCLAVAHDMQTLSLMSHGSKNQIRTVLRHTGLTNKRWSFDFSRWLTKHTSKFSLTCWEFGPCTLPQQFHLNTSSLWWQKSLTQHIWHSCLQVAVLMTMECVFFPFIFFFSRQRQRGHAPLAAAAQAMAICHNTTHHLAKQLARTADNCLKQSPNNKVCGFLHNIAIRSWSGSSFPPSNTGSQNAPGALLTSNSCLMTLLQVEEGF